MLLSKRAGNSLLWGREDLFLANGKECGYIFWYYTTEEKSVSWSNFK